ncbi:hypothetical protein AB0H20_23710 [Nocardia fluminea]|jgi:hypothetical protein|uniref:DUF8020 domain-containing protein n=1 Tax=Nocardia fluminea TaxID=134984 RepID=A0A2N3V8M6_9NOCA|nr:hypothetical protein [Nocardia fluminea]PKV77968.1 hypothetical protein ATK86_2322 [Nocardia fluminea]
MFSHTITRAGRRAVFAVLPLAVAASLVTTGTAAADVTVARQAEIAAGLSGEGVTDGVGYKTTVSPDLRTISATVDNGRFVLSADSTNVAVISDTGAKVSELPLTLATAGGNNVALASVVSEDGRTLQIAPQLSAATTDELKSIATNPEAGNHDPVQNGAAAGATIGFLTAAILCIPALAAFIIGYFFCAFTSGVSFAITGAVLGAVIGLVIPESIPQVLP